MVSLAPCIRRIGADCLSNLSPIVRNLTNASSQVGTRVKYKLTHGLTLWPAVCFGKSDKWFPTDRNFEGARRTDGTKDCKSIAVARIVILINWCDYPQSGGVICILPPVTAIFTLRVCALYKKSRPGALFKHIFVIYILRSTLDYLVIIFVWFLWTGEKYALDFCYPCFLIRICP